MSTLKEIAVALKNTDNFLVISHASPDGDTVGSATALIRALRSIGKKANFACSDTVSKNFDYLFEDLENEDFEIQNYITVDVASPQLLGNLKDTKVNIAIDHHSVSTVEADLRFCDSTAGANALIIYELLNEMNITISDKIANSLFTGISTDTGCFKFSNAGERIHLAAAKLITCGANFADINRRMFDSKTKAALKAEQEIFSNMEFCLDDKVVVASVPRDLLSRTGATENDLEAIPSLVRGIEGVVLSITLKEKEDGLWKASVRAVAPYNAAEICIQFGGGGHIGAAGCALTKDYQKSKSMLVKACKEHLESVAK
ncbi:MAG: DHH family phosphoesterase [Clostridia bacterium]